MLPCRAVTESVGLPRPLCRVLLKQGEYAAETSVEAASYDLHSCLCVSCNRQRSKSFLIVFNFSWRDLPPHRSGHSYVPHPLCVGIRGLIIGGSWLWAVGWPGSMRHHCSYASFANQSNGIDVASIGLSFHQPLKT
jgi:hypothetical protein